MAEPRVTTEVRAEAPARGRRRAAGAHPTPREYVRIAIVLAVITLGEVAIYYIESARAILIPTLFFFSFLKFALVVLWYMHLKFDNRTYARFFVMGLAAAVTLYLIVLVSFRVFAA